MLLFSHKLMAMHNLEMLNLPTAGHSPTDARVDPLHLALEDLGGPLVQDVGILRYCSENAH